ncbi:MAG: restriction endonuclease [Anaerolineae bacterium]|nr:restriction endonuclease [Anaerolineae bacterium]
MRSQRVFRTLSSLPGGNQSYLHTLNQILLWLAQESVVTRDELISWFIDRFGVSGSSIQGYVQILIRTNLIEPVPVGKLRLTSFGQQIATADPAQQKQLLSGFLLVWCAGFREILAVYANVQKPLHLREISTTLGPYFPHLGVIATAQIYTNWLLALGCVEQTTGRYYQITPHGLEVAETHPPIIYMIRHQSEVTDNQPSSQAQRIGQELHEASMDSHTPQRFQKAIALAFQFLGFEVTELGGPGETDVLLHALIGPESYTVIVDAKSRYAGILRDLSVATIQEHRHKHQADYALVIAGDFAGSKLIRHAEASGIALLTVPLLADWLRQYAFEPMNLLVQRNLFAAIGRITELPPGFADWAAQQIQWGELLINLVDLLRVTYTHGLTQPLPREQLFGMLVTRLHGVYYTEEQVQAAIAFLGHPIISTLAIHENKLTLMKSGQSLADTLHALSVQLVTTSKKSI